MQMFHISNLQFHWKKKVIVIEYKVNIKEQTRRNRSQRAIFKPTSLEIVRFCHQTFRDSLVYIRWDGNYSKARPVAISAISTREEMLRSIIPSCLLPFIKNFSRSSRSRDYHRLARIRALLLPWISRIPLISNPFS